MAPISPDNTQRFFVDYTTCGFPHTVMARAGSTVVASDASALMAAFFDALSPLFRLQTITGFRSAAPGTNITVPQTWLGDATYGDGSGDPFETAQYMDFVGRGATGHRVRIALFGCTGIQSNGDYRSTAAESAAVVNAIAALTADGDFFLDVDYEVPVWHQYANTGVNAYWRNKIR